ncbi:extracellular solute-binding protein [Ectobacillus polymachus]|uniref:extracellular solute-binding protein n=1 Tax=Ectobacillus polymachus TaxID=1508806 RepID=UPI003A85EB71
MNKNKMWKKMLVTMVGVTTLVGLSACGNDKAASTQDKNQKTTISLYSSGSLNVKDYWNKVIPMFEKQHPEIDVKLVFVDSGTSGQTSLDRIIAAKKTGKDSGIDILEGSNSDIAKGQKEGNIFVPLNQKDVPNLERVDPENLKGTNNFGLPYRASSVVLAYNSDKVKNAPSTPDELYQWIKANPGRFAYNDPSTGGAGDSFVITSIYNSLPADAMNNTDKSIMNQWDKGFQLLKDLNPYMYKQGVYPKKNQGTLDLLTSGEVDMIPAWSDMALEQINKGLLPKSTKLKQLTPQFTGGPSDLMVVDNGDKNKQKAADTFLNYVLSTDAQVAVVNDMYGYPGIKWSYLPQEMQKNFESVSGGYRSFNGGSDLSNELHKRWQKEVATK